MSNTTINKTTLDYQTIIRSVPDLYLILDTKFEIVEVSDAYLKATMVKREHILGRLVFDVFPDNPDDNTCIGVERLRSSLERVLRNKTTDMLGITKYDIRKPESEGGEFEERYWSPVNSPVSGKNNEVKYIILRVEDVTEFVNLKKSKTEQHKVTEELRTRTEQMESEILRRALEIDKVNHELRIAKENAEKIAKNADKMSQIKSEFLANMSHELRTPLNGIIGFSELIYNGKVGPIVPEQKEYMGDILTSSRHLLQLINDILDLTKVESGKMCFKPVKVDIRKLINETLNTLEILIEKKNIHIEVQVDPGLNNIIIDPERLKQIIYNYMSNAIKFTPENGKVIIRVLSDNTEYFRLEVQDTGEGIDKEKIDSLFNDFNQLDKSLIKKYQGTGLGLALTKQIVDAQGGTVGVCSNLGSGSTFYAHLPKTAVQQK